MSSDKIRKSGRSSSIKRSSWQWLESLDSIQEQEEGSEEKRDQGGDVKRRRGSGNGPSGGAKSNQEQSGAVVSMAWSEETFSLRTSSGVAKVGPTNRPRSNSKMLRLQRGGESSAVAGSKLIDQGLRDESHVSKATTRSGKMSAAELPPHNCDFK
jgi:hypothetical protein